MKDLEIVVPINIVRALTEEAQVTEEFYGEEGFQYLAPVKSLLEEGVKVVGESENAEPGPEWYFEVMHAYVNRSTVGREDEEETEEFQPEEAVDPVTALKLITTWSAEFCYGQDLIGSLEPGKFGDFVIAEENPLEASEDELRDNEVILTVTDGEAAYDNTGDDATIESGGDAEGGRAEDGGADDGADRNASDVDDEGNVTDIDRNGDGSDEGYNEGNNTSMS